MDCDEVRVRHPAGYFGRVVPVTCRIPYIHAQTDNEYTPSFFIADRHYEVLSAAERHEVAAFGPIAHVHVKRVPTNVATASGTDVLLGTFDLTLGADTVRRLEADPANCHLNPGDSLALYTGFGAGAAGLLEGVTVSVYLRAV